MPMTVLINDCGKVKKSRSNMINDKHRKIMFSSLFFFVYCSSRPMLFERLVTGKVMNLYHRIQFLGKVLHDFYLSESDFPLPTSVTETAITCNNSYCCWTVLCCDGNGFSISVNIICSTKISDTDTQPQNFIMILHPLRQLLFSQNQL